MSSPYASLHILAREILLRAWKDLRCPQPELKQDATQFLTASTPEYTESLELWCALAQVDPNRVIARTESFLTTGALIV